MLVSTLRYLTVGVFNTLVGIGTIFLCKWAWSMPDIPANACGYGLGVLVSFTLNRQWTFRDRGPRLSAFVRFVIVLLFAYVANLATVLFCIHGLRIDSYVAHILGVGPYTVVGFIGSKWFAFRSQVA